jgi:hypothetical protein
VVVQPVDQTLQVFRPGDVDVGDGLEVEDEVLLGRVTATAGADGLPCPVARLGAVGEEDWCGEAEDDQAGRGGWLRGGDRGEVAALDAGTAEDVDWRPDRLARSA